MISTFSIASFMMIAALSPLSRYLGEKLSLVKFVGGSVLKIFGKFCFIFKYWEWVKHILSCFKSQLRTCRLFDAVYASLYTYDRDPHVILTFCEAWCSKTNTLHTRFGEILISLWNLYKLGGLPMAKFMMKWSLTKMHYINVIRTVRD